MHYHSIEIKSQKKFVQTKHKTFGSNVFSNRKKTDFQINTRIKSILEGKAIPFSNCPDGTDDESNWYRAFEDENCSINTKFTQNEMILLYEKMKHNLNQSLHPDYNVWIELLKILQEIDAPLNAFDKIMNWVTKSKMDGYKFSNSYPSRKLLMRELNEILCGNALKPCQKPLSLDDDSSELVTTFDFESMCFSLLTDDTIMKDENFTFINDDPRIFNQTNNTKITCIEDGSVYQEIAKRICKEPEDFCLGIKLFIDATHTDVHSKWILDPVMFTFTFLKNQVTRQHNAWRPIGFINDQGKKSCAENQQVSSASKLQHFHNQLEIILESVKKCQQKGGFEWNLKYKNAVYRTKMFPVIILIIGDAQGNHKLCGMYNSFYGTSRVNHSCDCPWIRTDDENVECDFMSHQYVKKLCESNKEDDLKEISQHNIINAFDTVVMGSHAAGLNALMPAEILHQMFWGVIEYALNGFVHLYSKKALSRFDNYARVVYPISIHNSDRTIPNLNCQYGYTNLTKQKDSDRVGICLTVLLSLSSDVAEQFGLDCNKAPSNQTRNMYRILFQNILLYIEWLSQPSYNLITLKSNLVKIKLLMRQLRLSVRRENNKGLKVGKFHEMLHVIRDIELFGPSSGYDGRPGESSHKDTKKCAVKTQRRKNMFEYQTGYRIYENLLVCKASSFLAGPKKIDIKKRDVKDEDRLQGLTTTSHYYIFRNETGEIIENLTNQRISKSTAVEFHQIVSEFIFTHLLENNIIGKLNCRTFIRLNNDLLIRCTPLFNNTNSYWYDWVWINWEYKDGSTMIIPAQVYSIIDLRFIEVHNSTIKPGFYVCIRSISKVPTPKWRNSNIIYAGSFELNDEGNTMFRLVHVENIVKGCYAIPDFNSLEFNIWKTTKWLFVIPKDEWSTLF